jgi:hypothetical protein
VQVEFFIPILGLLPDKDYVIETTRKTGTDLPVSLSLTRNRNKNFKTKFGAKHSVYDLEEVSIIQSMRKCHSELSINGTSFDYFDATIIHAFLFLTVMRLRHFIYSPIFSTRSCISGKANEYTGDSVQPLVDLVPGHIPQIKKVGRTDIEWIEENLDKCEDFMKLERFQSCMQALTSFQNIPSTNISFFTVCTGIEAFFKINGHAKKSKIGVATEALLGSQSVTAAEINALFDLRNKVAHGEHVQSGVSSEHAFRAHELLCMCLEQAVNKGGFP